MGSIEEEFRDLSVVMGRTLIFRPADAITFVRRCREKQVKLLGLDAFHLDADSIQPDMGASIDLSLPVYSGQDLWTLAERFLDQRLESGLYFEVIVNE